MEEDPDPLEDSEVIGRREEGNAERGRITREMISDRAYQISQSDQAGTDEENWLRAEQELRQEQELQDG